MYHTRSDHLLEERKTNYNVTVQPRSASSVQMHIIGEVRETNIIVREDEKAPVTREVAQRQLTLATRKLTSPDFIRQAVETTMRRGEREESARSAK